MPHILGISFVHTPLDLKKLREEIERISGTNIAVVAKIETQDAVHQLARIILEGLKFSSFGIMIARGDLAVEVGLGNLPIV
ncbi:pyruvate kinase [Peribacillus frigoritolerans]